MSICAFCFAGAALPAKHLPRGVEAQSFATPKAFCVLAARFQAGQRGRASAAGFPVCSFQQ
jgi:hypothetical protein